MAYSSANDPGLWNRASPINYQLTLKLRIIGLLIFLPAAFTGEISHAQEASNSTAGLDSKSFGLLAIQDNGRRKPIDTFAKETLIRISGRSSYASGSRRWSPNDFILSALTETHDWKSEPMVLVSFAKLKEKLGLDRSQRRFSFSQLAGLAELSRLANEAREKRRAEKPLERLEQEALSVSDRLTLFANVMDGSAFLIVPAAKNETDPWVVPPAFSQYYGEEQFASAQTQLQALASAYAQADSFNFSRAANQLRQDLRALSPSIYPQDRQLRLEYFYNHFEAFYRAIWFCSSRTCARKEARFAISVSPLVSPV